MYASRVNPLLSSVLHWLHTTPLPASEYALIQYLDDVLPAWPCAATDDASLRIFYKHFLVMNALYQLQITLREQRLHLAIDPLAITLHETALHSDMPATQNCADNQDALAAYYLDWSHFQAATTASVDDLLNAFWQRYQRHTTQQATTAITDACAVLQVEVDADWATVRRAYQRLVKKMHPDSGGQAQDFIRVRAAYEQLRWRNAQRAAEQNEQRQH